MKNLALLALLLLLASAAAAQRGGFRGGFSGFGGRGFSAGFGRGGFVGGFVHRGPGFGFRAGHFGFNRFHSRGFYGMPYGYAWPVYVGGYYEPYSNYYGNYAYYNPQPAVTVVSPYPAEPQPPVIVTQNIAPLPQVRVYEPAPPPVTSGPALYLLAFKDGVIRAALAYWTEGSQVRWLDMDHKQQSAATEKLDRELSERLNRERRVPFQLP